MNIIRQNTIPSFEIVSRIPMIELSYDVEIISEFSQKKQTISAISEQLPNENYLITLNEFPEGKVYEKFSFKIENVCLGKFIIVSETEDIQNYAKKTSNPYY